MSSKKRSSEQIGEDTKVFLNFLNFAQERMRFDDFSSFNMELLISNFIKTRNSLKAQRLAMVELDKFNDKLQIANKRGSGGALANSKEATKIQERVELAANQLSKDILQLYRFIQLFFIFHLMNYDDIASAHIYISNKRNPLLDKDGNPEITNTKKLRNCHIQFSKYAAMSLSIMVREFDEIEKYKDLIYLKRNFYALTTFRNILAHENLARMLPHLNQHAIKIFDSILEETLDDIKTINFEFPDRVPKTFNETMARDFINKNRRDNFGQVSLKISAF